MKEIMNPTMKNEEEGGRKTQHKKYFHWLEYY
jgi:hypothetical protein